MNHIVTYSEIDPFASDWLESLAQNGAIRPGRNLGDIKSIREPSEIFHAFAGIGGWELALELAGYTGPVWTGSCPCQPFSEAGSKQGVKDERHLWPEWLRLIKKHRPPVIFGEQVASPLGKHWLADVSADLEALGYRVASADLCAAGVGAPHIRHRLFFGAHRMADGHDTGLERLTQHGAGELNRKDPNGPAGSTGSGLRVGDTNSEYTRWDTGAGPRPQRESPFEGVQAWRIRNEFSAPGTTHWGSTDWLLCRNPTGLPTWRPVEPGTFPLANGLPTTVGRLRGYGNAIVPQVAAVFIQSFMESL